jgi:hypothetical protein
MLNRTNLVIYVTNLRRCNCGTYFIIFHCACAWIFLCFSIWYRWTLLVLYGFYCAVLWMFVIMKWRPSKSEEHLHVSNYFLEYCDGILLTTARPVWTPEQASCYLYFTGKLILSITIFCTHAFYQLGNNF